jgi:hypothetical protein
MYYFGDAPCSERIASEKSVISEQRRKEAQAVAGCASLINERALSSLKVARRDTHKCPSFVSMLIFLFAL